MASIKKISPAKSDSSALKVPVKSAGLDSSPKTKAATPVLVALDVAVQASPPSAAKPPATKAPLATSLANAFAPPKAPVQSAGPTSEAGAGAAKTVRAVKAPKATESVKSTKSEKTKKPKLVRDSFTIPKSEYVVLEELKQRANQLAQPAKKSELLRAGIKALAAMSDSALQKALSQVPAIKTGRPAANS